MPGETSLPPKLGGAACHLPRNDGGQGRAAHPL